MNTELFIAKRTLNVNKKRKRFSGTITDIVIFGIAISMAVMITSMAIVTGFKNEIRNKVIGFGSHIQLTNYDSNLSYQTRAIPAKPEILDDIRNIDGVRHVQPFALKAGIVKTETDLQGLVLKGIDGNFDWKFFSDNLIEGEIFSVSDSAYQNKIVISSYIAKNLRLKTGDSFQMWFVDDNIRFRKFTISGIYETSLAEFDQTFSLVDIKHIQRLNNWDEESVSGFEILIDNFNSLDKITLKAGEIASMYYLEDGSRLKVQSITEMYPQIFDWLNLQDINVLIIISLMLVVAGFNMISGLIILILERTYMIGVLKAIGYANFSIRKIFMYQSVFLILKGLFWGNLAGLTLCWIQKRFELIRLDPENYYLTTVPVNFDLLQIILINIGAICIIMLFLILPSLLVSRISPSKTIRFA